MIVLAIESATACAGVAIGTPDGVIASAQVTRGPRHAEVLIPAVEFVCRHAGIALSEIDAIAVDIGPGLFTGLRVGIATANGLAQSLDKPMLGVPSLDLLAHAHRHVADDIVAVIDARRSEVYAARYAVSDDLVTRVQEPMVLPPADLLAQFESESGVSFVGDTLTDHGAKFAHPSAETLARIAPSYDLVQANTVQPLYLRRSDAELNAERKGV